MRKSSILPLVGGLPLLFVISCVTHAVTLQEAAVYSLAQRCVVVQSPGNGELVNRYNDMLGITRYHFGTSNIAAASRFYLKPASLGQFLMLDRDARFMSSRVSSLEIATSGPETGSEWRISASAAGSGYRYGLRNVGTSAPLSHNFGFLGLQTETQFNLLTRPASECATFPEVQLNVEAPGYANPRDALKTRPDHIRGYIDGHTHLTAEESFGGNSIAGHTFHRWGAPHALKDCREIHGEGGKQDLMGAAVGGYASHNTAGWPQFTAWPAWNTSVTHTGYYYKWVERAHLSGMRLMVVYTVENEVLCRLGSLLGEGGKSCDTLDSVRRQVDDLYALQNYVDAQSGGPGKGFFRIVLDPAAARQVIADGKLAVVIGIEASETFNCSDLDSCSADKLKGRLDTYKAFGVRSIFPVHKFDTQVGGATINTPSLDMMNIGNVLDNGHYFGVEACDAATAGATINSDLVNVDPAKIFSGYDSMAPVLKTAVTVAAGAVNALTAPLEPHYDSAVANGNACNSRGLTQLGGELINAMIDRKILIDTDHESTKMTSAVLDIAERRGYSGIVASHGDTDENKMDPSAPHYNYVRIARLGGHISVIGRTTRRFPEVATPGFKAMKQAAEEKGYVAGIGIGSDVNGLIKMPGPLSADPLVSPLQYPFTNEFGLTFYRQVSGNRTFDLNQDGMAHYGMLPDLMASYAQWMRGSGQQEMYESMMNSAESYLQMWERAVR